MTTRRLQRLLSSEHTAAGESYRRSLPPRPTIEQLAASLGLTVEQLRAAGESYRRSLQPEPEPAPATRRRRRRLLARRHA